MRFVFDTKVVTNMVKSKVDNVKDRLVTDDRLEKRQRKLDAQKINREIRKAETASPTTEPVFVNECMPFTNN